ncbi:FecR family protein [Sphingomonas nostoxanthinifaciens]|uniref:FecR family protein n=1 Tax=Sphingomonas nostoxanthinifaciens TaxID=2872652 RepID=UPI001CC1F4F2|nr:FecR domain-containing protein [Sphingomonas nostoxanthinifaciens]UAK22876.1 FecR domain-containing protein [Sphingomonas nostoxanthinifaciens]
MVAAIDRNRLSDRRASADDPALAEALTEVAAFGRLSNEQVRAMRANRRRAVGSVAAVALAAVLGLGGWMQLQTPAPTTIHYSTARGEQRLVHLADGSSVRLNGATRLDVTLDRDRRTVELAEGQAFFDVAHDAKRPFVVTAGAVNGRVLGTAFDVDRMHGQVELEVYRGAVRFAGTAPGSAGVVVRAGWRSRYRDGTIDRPTLFDPAQQDWREGWLDTEGMRLGDVVEALDRGTGPLVLPPPARLAALPIAGRFRLDDPARLLRVIGGAYGFTVVRDGDRIRLQPAAATRD